MPHLIKTGNAVMKVGNNVMQQNADIPFAANASVTSLPLSTSTNDLEVANNKLYIGSVNGSAFFIVNLDNYGLIPHSITGISPAVHIETNRLFVGKSSTIEVRDLTTLALITTINGYGANKNIKIDTVNQRILAYNSGTINALDLNTYTFVGSITGLTTNAYPGMAVDTNGNRLFVTSGNPNGILVYNLQTLALTGSFSTPAPLTNYPFGIYVDVPNNVILFSQAGNNNIVMYDYINPFSGKQNSYNYSGSFRQRGIAKQDTRIFVARESGTGITIINNLF